jgi:hypothetical protein
MAAHTARTLLLTGAGVGLFAAFLARRVSVGGVPRPAAADRLPAPARDPFRESRATPRSGQSIAAVPPAATPGPAARPLIPAQRKRT